VQVLAGQRRLAELGFKQGGMPGYGLRECLFRQTESSPSLLQSRAEGDYAKLVGNNDAIAQERDRVEKQLAGLNAALTAFASAYGGTKPSRKRRKMSAKSRAKIAATQRARWAKFRAKKKG
jgi:hypothetical protein